MYLASRNSKVKRKIENEDQDEVYYIHEFKRAHLEPEVKSKQLHQPKPSILVKSDEIGYLKPLKPSNLKLFDMCLRFIAENLEHVDTLNGFPEHIGHLLLDECVQISKFDSDKSPNSFRCFKMFTDAYSYCMIDALNLANQSNLLRDLKSIISTCSLTSLDLSNCDLIEFDDLNLILQESLNTLEYLNLSNNKLDANYVKKLTLAQRLNYSNYAKLKRIDLSENFKLKSIDLICNYFEKFPNLNEIYLSKSVDDLINESKLTLFKLCKCNHVNNNNLKTTNTGWIENISIEKLISSKKCVNSSQEYKDLVREIRSGKQANTKLSFYTKSNISQANENYKTTNLSELYKLIKLKRDCKCFQTASRLSSQSSRVLEHESPIGNTNKPKLKSINYVIDKELLNLYS